MTAWAPLCMTPAEFAAWHEMNARMSAGQAKRPCEDCPLGYAAEMRGHGLCNGSPGGVEEEDEVEIQQLKAKAAVVSVRIDVPCERCVHREVCGIRAQIADLNEVEMELPALNAALKPALTMAIECGFFQVERGKGKTGRVAGRPLTDAELAARKINVAKAQEARRANRSAESHA